MDNHIPRRIRRPYVVFISHSDEELAIQTKNAIEKYAKIEIPQRLAPFGVKALVAERKELPGEDLKEKLGKMIQVSSRIVVLLTIKATRSEMVRWEMEKAQELGKKIIPFVENKECTVAVNLPETLEWHLLDKNNLSHIGEHLAKDIKQAIPGLHWLEGWRLGVIVNWGIRKLAKRKAEDNAWYWLQQHGIDP